MFSDRKARICPKCLMRPPDRRDRVRFVCVVANCPRKFEKVRLGDAAARKAAAANAFWQKFGSKA
jgi:hypothetical protein